MKIGLVINILPTVPLQVTICSRSYFSVIKNIKNKMSVVWQMEIMKVLRDNIYTTLSARNRRVGILSTVNWETV